MSSFDKYFNSIQDKASRYYRRLADLDDLIYDKYFNKFRGKTVFEAEVLSDPGEIPAEGSTANTDLFVPLRVRIKDIHDNRLPDPYEAVKGIKDEVKKLDQFRKLILSHPVAYPDTKNLMESSISKGITQGSTVEVYFSEEGPDFNGRMRGLRYRQVILASPTRTIPTGLSVSSGFEAGQTSALGDASWKPKSGANIPDDLKTRLDEFMVDLSAAGFRGEITINSGLRTLEAQAQAMMTNMFDSNGNWIENTDTQTGAVEWTKSTYRNATILHDLVESNFISKTPKNSFKVALEGFLNTNTGNGQTYYQRLTDHDTGDAADIKTNDKTYAEAKLILDGCERSKNKGLIRSFEWEKGRDNKDSQIQSGEHIHINFKPNSEGEGE